MAAPAPAPPDGVPPLAPVGQLVAARSAMTQDKRHHSAEIKKAEEQLEQAKTHHDKELKEARKHHKQAMEQDKSLTLEQLQQANLLHAEAIQQEHLHHHVETELSKALQDTALYATRVLHTDSKKYQLQLFHKELAHAQQVSRKETIRDSLVQEAQRAQAIMIVNTLMFGCCFGVLIEGHLPPGTPQPLVVGFSTTLIMSLSFLIISVWFAMNLQSRITKYRIHDPTVLYGKERERFVYYVNYHERHCKPIYRLTCLFLWMGTVSLLVNGSILLCTRFAFTYESQWGCVVFAVGQTACLCVLCALLVVYGGGVETTQPRAPEEDFHQFERFIKNMHMQLHSSDHTCAHCRLPVDLFLYCPARGGLRHGSEAAPELQCPDCKFNVGETGWRSCPVTEVAYVLPNAAHAALLRVADAVPGVPLRELYALHAVAGPHGVRLLGSYYDRVQEMRSRGVLFAADAERAVLGMRASAARAQVNPMPRQAVAQLGSASSRRERAVGATTLRPDGEVVVPCRLDFSEPRRSPSIERSWASSAVSTGRGRSGSLGRTSDHSSPAARLFACSAELQARRDPATPSPVPATQPRRNPVATSPVPATQPALQLLGAGALREAKRHARVSFLDAHRAPLRGEPAQPHAAPTAP